MPNASAVDRFRELHESGCFVMPNPWDAGSAVFLERLGSQALATTSAGFAFTLGRPDSVTALSLEGVLDHARVMVEATALPLNVDFQSGYASDAAGVEKNVAQCLRTGAAGVSIEDATGEAETPLYDRATAIERVRAACAARDAVEPRAILTARCEAWLVGDDTPKRTALDRLVAFAEAGADCLFAPGVTDPGDIAEIVDAVAPKPVNVLCSGPGEGLSVSRLADLGVRRISVGSALARVGWAAVMRAAGAILEDGTFETLGEAASFDELNGLFERATATS